MSASRYSSAVLIALSVLCSYGMTACAASPTQESLGEQIDDSVITTKVKARFVEDKTVDASNISVETYKGIVQLSGFAVSDAESRKAEELARTVKGVRSVKNDIRLRTSTR